MAEEQNKADAAASGGSKLPIKTLIVLAVVVVVEAVAISAVFLLAGGPADVKADGAQVDPMADADRLVEELVLDDKFQNTKTGRTYVYDTTIYVVVKQKHREQVARYIEEMQAQIKADVAIIYRRAEPTHLLEPTLGTLKRMIKASLDEKIGRDEEGDPIIDKVLITKFSQFRADL